IEGLRKINKNTLGCRYDNKEDFAVVLQPFFKSTILPFNAEGQPDVTYFSQDCFHFSERGHADMAVALWNNMMEPVGEKQTYNAFSNGRDRIKCPTEVRNQLQKHFLLELSYRFVELNFDILLMCSRNILTSSQR
uniref:Uncharacterized protein n=1 Tax=Oreochromis aureus TaxID=47969 RepID=A0A668U0G7_OREAU